MNDRTAIREEMIATCRRMNAAQLNSGSAGNLSVRIDGGFLITPSGLPYDTMTPSQIVEMDLEGRYYGDFLPSSEWRFHYDILRQRMDIDVVLHSHAPYCSMLACCRLDLPPIHYMVAIAGGTSVKCSGYAPFGTKALSEEALAALGPRNACLLGNHGVIALGKTMAKAFAVLEEIEYVARVYVGTRSLGGVILGEDEMSVVLERFRTYGKQPSELTESDLSSSDRIIPPPRGGDRMR